MLRLMRTNRMRAAVFLCSSVIALSGCAGLGSSGPRTAAVREAGGKPVGAAPIKIVELTAPVAERLLHSSHSTQFADIMGQGLPIGTVLGRGDVIDVSIWEAPPAALFGTAMGDLRMAAGSSGSSVSRSSSLPEQIIDANGRINIPFAGYVLAAGKSPAEVEQEIVRRLTGKAHDPQAVVRLVRNATANVTVLGDVGSSMRVPLTPKGERLLDILASAGGVKQPVGKTTIQITRGLQVVSMPLERILSDPRQNIIVQPNDVITALFQPYSFTSLGATGQNAEISFEATGITLAQALGRVGGLRDDRADVRGVFVFRFEDPAAMDPETVRTAQLTPDGKVPVIYRVDLRNPASFFVAQGFMIHNRDILYVSNAPGTDLQKFVNLVTQVAFTAVSIGNAAN